MANESLGADERIWRAVRSSGVVLLILFIAACVYVVVASVNQLGEPERARTAPTTSSTPSDSASIQGVTTKRTEVEILVSAMIARHAIASIGTDRNEAQVNPAFWDSADLNGKRGLAIVIAQYCKIQDPSAGGAVTIKSSRSGRKLAEYSSWSGVKIQGED
jgi:hypothetical protein